MNISHFENIQLKIELLLNIIKILRNIEKLNIFN